MDSIREPAVAGTFYPNDAASLSALLSTYLDPSESATAGTFPKAIIAPHAGYIYSGLTAGKIYSQVAGAHDQIRRVVLFGPSHRVAFKGMALPTSSAFRTPLGDIPLDITTIESLASHNAVGYLDQAHAQEHSLEVHLPFLQSVIDEFKLVPIVVGEASPAAVSEVLDAVWEDDETLVVISSDLSHYHPYAEAQSIDSATCDKIERLEPTLIGEEACGCRPINGLLHYLKQQGLTINRVDVRNSGDTAGDKNRVVGYGAWQVGKGEVKVSSATSQNESTGDEWSTAERQAMIQLAREVIRSPLQGEKNFNLNLDLYNDHLKQERAAFVTIKLSGNLRGCIGSLVAHRPLIVDIANNAQSAAFKDPRFKGLTLEEFKNIELHISILTAPVKQPVNSTQELLTLLRPGIDGLIIREQGKQSTYLPSVWEQLSDPLQFIRELRRKAGLNADGWHETTEILTYQTEEFS